MRIGDRFNVVLKRIITLNKPYTASRPIDLRALILANVIFGPKYTYNN